MSSDEQQVVRSLNEVRERVAMHAKSRAASSDGVAAAVPMPPTLIAVSKTKPPELIAAAHGAGHLDFGENYVQEVVAKAPTLPSDIRWHFIGHLQTNKVKDLLGVPNLHCVHTVDTLKLAQELQKRSLQMRPDQPLAVFVQVNTSGEESKSGCTPAECVALCTAVRDSCSALCTHSRRCAGGYRKVAGRLQINMA